jgi:uncharacterized zinc-type alcohol dehydrogenase-like protein
MSLIKAWAAKSKGVSLELFEYDPGLIGPNEVEVKVHYCGICHSDISMIDNAWQSSVYPLVPGHEVIGEVILKGSHVKNLRIGQIVGIGWTEKSCMECKTCLQGDQNLCKSSQGLIVGHHGGFADRVRASSEWVIKLPKNLDPSKAGPLMCGGITVFNPLLQFNVPPTAKIGVVGIGGLGHLALKFFKAWGMEVTAFTSHMNKEEDILKMGAHRVVSINDKNQIAKLQNSLDFLLVTSNVSLDFNALIDTLGPKGHIHFVGAVLNIIPITVFQLLGYQRKISATPTGSIASIMSMLEFASRHTIEPIVEIYPLSQVNKALENLRKGQVKYRIVLKNDF